MSAGMQIQDIKEHSVHAPLIKVVGIGGGGGNAVNRMMEAGLDSVDFVVGNTDLQDLNASHAPYKIQFGPKCTRGLGAGSKPNLGREAAVEDLNSIKECLRGADMVFITAGLGGGTGSGATPVVAEVASELNCLTVCVVTKPFRFEGAARCRNAEESIVQIRKHVDTLIVIPNDNLLGLSGKETSILEAFSMADDVLRVAIQGISDLITKDALINLDFADVRTVMGGMGQAIMGIGVGEGENRALEAAEKAIHSPLLDDCRIDGAKGILINVSGSASLGILEANEAVSYITELADKDANVIFGANIKPDMPEEKLEVTVIATGFDSTKDQKTGTAEAGPVYYLGTDKNSRSERLENVEDHHSHLGELKSVPDSLAEEHLAFVDKENVSEILEADKDATASVSDIACQAEDKGAAEAPLETEPSIPSSYQNDDNQNLYANNLDVPAFIRRRNHRVR